jgi:ribonuclease BN (tRNA processing enzyme)
MTTVDDLARELGIVVQRSPRITVVGCAGSAPGPDSACSSYLVERDGFSLLLDLGTGACGPLQRYLAPQQVDAAFFTHAHGDHAGDVWSLLYFRERFGAPGRLPVYGPPSVEEVMTTRAPVADYITFEAPSARIGPWRVRTAVGVHRPENWAVRLDDSLFYTGDTEPCDAVDDLAHGCAVLLAGASGFDAERPAGHLTAGDAGRLAHRSGAKLLVLTHLRSWQDHTDLLDEAARECECPVLLAAPGLRLSLPG